MKIENINFSVIVKLAALELQISFLYYYVNNMLLSMKMYEDKILMKFY